jgi:TolA-binding protein
VAGNAIPDDKQAHYDLAKKLFDDGNHDAAIQAFDLFLLRHKETDAKDGKGLVDNAHFWLGEAHYARAKNAKDEKERGTGFKKAILSYQKVLETPGSNKADGALLKIGLAFEAVGYSDEAKVFYEEILANHPKSPLAKDAKERIAILAKNAKPKGKKTK